MQYPKNIQLEASNNLITTDTFTERKKLFPSSLNIYQCLDLRQYLILKRKKYTVLLSDVDIATVYSYIIYAVVSLSINSA